MKLAILNKEGEKEKEIQTKLFEEPIRLDIIRKVVEAERIWQPYSNTFRAGMNRSASGNVRHKRHSWKSDRGRGLARIPKKQMWRRGTQFSWEGAIVPSTRGGRRAHPPKLSVNLKKINKKEFKKALLSTLSYINSIDEIKKKYSSLNGKNVKINLPLVFDEKVFLLKTNEFLEFLKKFFGELQKIIIQKKNLRAGKGKIRGRKYKKNAGLLFVIGKDENKKIKGIDIVKSNKLTVSNLAGNGARITIFSEKAIEEIENFIFGEKEGKKKETSNKQDKMNEGQARKSKYSKSNKILSDNKINKENFEKIENQNSLKKIIR